MDIGDGVRWKLVDIAYNENTWLGFLKKKLYISIYFVIFTYTSLYCSDYASVVRNIYIYIYMNLIEADDGGRWNIVVNTYNGNSWFRVTE